MQAACTLPRHFRATTHRTRAPAPQIAVAAAQEQQAGVIEREQAAQSERLAALARRAAAVCAAAASGDGAAAATAQEYESAFEAILDYVMEAAGLAPPAAAADAVPLPAAGTGKHGRQLQLPRRLGTGNRGGRAGGSSGDGAARAEASAALGSAFPLSAVARWVTLPPGERLQQLLPLARLTLGICLFNGSSGAAAAATQAGALGGTRGTASSRASSRGAGGSGSGGAGACELAVAVQLQQAARLVESFASTELAAWDALGDANRTAAAASPADATSTAASGPAAAAAAPAAGGALFCAQAATALRRMGADARQGLAACRELEAALEEELAVVSAKAGPF